LHHPSKLSVFARMHPQFKFQSPTSAQAIKSGTKGLMSTLGSKVSFTSLSMMVVGSALLIRTWHLPASETIINPLVPELNN
jgi:hypothetical protein